MSILKCDYCGKVIESGLENLFTHMEKCDKNKIYEKLSSENISITAIHTKPMSFTVIDSDLKPAIH
jgi:ribosomal protein L24E